MTGTHVNAKPNGIDRDTAELHLADVLSAGVLNDVFADGAIRCWRTLYHGDRGTFDTYATRLDYNAQAVLMRRMREDAPGSVTEPTIDVQDAAEFIRTLDPPAFILEPLIARGHLLSVTGHANSAKTTTAVQLVLAQTGLVRLPGLEATPLRVLYLIGENDNNLRGQFLAACQQHRIDPKATGEHIDFIPRRLSIAENIVGIAELAKRRGGYDAGATIEASPDLKGVLDALASGVFSPTDTNRYRPIIDSLYHGDWFMVAADFEAYAQAQRDTAALWRRTADWTEKAILNSVNMGWFSSDRTIREYARDIWNVPVV